VLEKGWCSSGGRTKRCPLFQWQKQRKSASTPYMKTLFWQQHIPVFVFKRLITWHFSRVFSSFALITLECEIGFALTDSLFVWYLIGDGVKGSLVGGRFDDCAKVQDFMKHPHLRIEFEYNSRNNRVHRVNKTLLCLKNLLLASTCPDLGWKSSFPFSSLFTSYRMLLAVFNGYRKLSLTSIQIISLFFQS
jgi:hypothetical protein